MALPLRHAAHLYPRHVLLPRTPWASCSDKAALGIPEQKDQVGYRLMLQYCVPRSIDENGRIVWWDEASGLDRLYSYCKRDVEVERAISKRMLKLSSFEQRVWQLDQKINSRGIKVDLPAVEACVKVVELEKEKLTKEIRDASDNTIAAPTCTQQIKDFLELHGVDGVTSIAKADAGLLLDRTDLPEACRRVLNIRGEAGKTSTAKLQAMREGASPWDSRLRGLFQFSGANTRRWAGRRVQLQNLPRTKINAALVNDILAEMPKLTPDKIRLFYGLPLDVISNCLRGLLVADEGKEFLVCDFSAIEARVIAWLAGQESVLEVFRNGGDVYVEAAKSIFGKKEITPEERQIGKVAVLALGYQGGVGALQKMAKAYGVCLAPAYRSLVARATLEQRDFVEKRYEQSEKEISREEFIASDLTKVFWRLANPKIVGFWARLESGAILAVKGQGKVIANVHHPIEFKKSGSFLFCKLPSGGVLSFPYPQVGEAKMPWGDTREALTYMSEDQNHKWTRFKTYGGSLAENVTQSFARDLLADAMLRLEAQQYEIVAHVHDEILCEVPSGFGSVEHMSNTMCENPLWAGGLPLHATGYRAKRYRKS